LTLRQLATWTIVLGFALPLSAIERSATISGYVRDASGNPQMGAVVEILDATDRTLTVFSDGAGYYTATGLLPGLYSLKASAPSFLPALREKIGLRPGASINVNVTLNTLLDMMQLGPVRNLPDSDDWKWTLRSVANRPILRIFDDPNTTVEKQDHELRGTLSFLAGSAAAGYGTGSDMSAGFTLERSMFSGGRLAFSGDVGYGQSLPAAVLRAGYAHHSDTGGETTIGVTVHRFAPSDPNLHNAALQALALSASDDVTLADIVELKFGSEMQTIQFLGNVTAFRPYGTADVHLNPDTVLAYEYTTSRPDMRNEKGFDSSPADLSESNPRVAVLNYAPQVERAQHQEVSFSHRIGKNNLQLAAYYDHVGNTVLTGTGNVTAAGGFLLPDVTSGTFSYAGGNLNTNGMRAVLQRKFSSDLTATIDYAYGGALNLTQADVQLQSAQQAVATQRRHAVAAKLSGTLPHTHT